MSSLSISFTDDEYRQLLEAADRASQTVELFIHDAVVRAAVDYQRRVSELAVDIASKSAESNRRLE